MATYSDEQIAYMLANGGRLFRANNQLFIVEQTGLIIGPITVDNAAFFTTRNSIQEITMSGENFKNPLEVISSTSGLTITNVSVDSRSQISFTINADLQPPKGGHELEYQTRSGFDSSSATIRNNVVILPAEPLLSAANLGGGRSFLEVGAGLATSEHPSGHAIDLVGDQMYDLQQVEDALQDAATLAGLGLTAPAGNDLRVRVGKLAGGLWTDDPECAVTINSVAEGQVGVTIDIDSDFAIAYGSDVRSLDVVVETYSGDLGAASPADNFARAGDNKDYSGSYAILVDALVVRRARPQSFTKVTMLDDAVLPTAGDDASIAAAIAAGTELFPNQVAVFRQQEVKKFIFECQSAHDLDGQGVSQDPACIDSSAVLKNTLSATAPAGGRIHAPSTGANAPSNGFGTAESGDNLLTVLSETAFMVQMRMRDDQEIDEYTLALTTQSSEGDFSICEMSFDLTAGVFTATTIDIRLVSPEVMEAQGALVTADFTGDGLPEGFGISGHPNELGAAEGSVAAQAFPASPGATDAASFAMQVSNIQVSSDDAMSIDLQHAEADVLSYIGASASRSVEDLLGNYTTRFTVTDALGNQQVQDLTQIRVQHKWPPEADSIGGSDGQNMLREDSLNDPDMLSVDTIEIDLVRLRGHHDVSATSTYPLVNGFSAISEFPEHEIKLVKLDQNGDIEYDVSTQSSTDLITESDAAGTDKPIILITAVRAAKAGFGALDSAGVQQEVYKWELDCKVVSEEAMEKSAAAPNGLEDVCTDPAYGGAMLALAVRTVNGDDDQLTDWAIFPDVFEIMPANIEVTAAAHELARADAENISMAGDNFYPQGGGNGSGGYGGSSSGGSSSGGSSSGGSSSGGSSSGGGSPDIPGAPMTWDQANGVVSLNIGQNDAQVLYNGGNGLLITTQGGGGYNLYVSQMDLNVTSQGLEIANQFSPDWANIGSSVDVYIQ